MGQGLFFVLFLLDYYLPITIMLIMKYSKGFTLVELMVVVAIIGLLAAIAVPNLAKARQEARLKACLNNLRLIDHATEQAGMADGTIQGGTPDQTHVDAYIKGGAPVCPSGGNYTYPAMGGNASCSIHGTTASPNRNVG